MKTIRNFVAAAALTVATVVGGSLFGAGEARADICYDGRPEAGVQVSSFRDNWSHGRDQYCFDKVKAAIRVGAIAPSEHQIAIGQQAIREWCGLDCTMSYWIIAWSRGTFPGQDKLERERDERLHAERMAAQRTQARGVTHHVPAIVSAAPPVVRHEPPHTRRDGGVTVNCTVCFGLGRR